MTILFRDPDMIKQAPHLHQDLDVVMINKDRQIVLNPLEELDMEEKLAVLTDIINADPIQNELNVVNQRWDSVKTVFGKMATETVQGYKCNRYKVTV